MVTAKRFVPGMPEGVLNILYYSVILCDCLWFVLVCATPSDARCGEVDLDYLLTIGIEALRQ